MPEARASKNPLSVTDEPEGGLRNPLGGEIASIAVIPTSLDKGRNVLCRMDIPVVSFGQEFIRQRAKVGTEIQRRPNECDVLDPLNQPSVRLTLR